jgi:hypothetical protein
MLALTIAMALAMVNTDRMTKNSGTKFLRLFNEKTQLCDPGIRARLLRPFMP